MSEGPTHDALPLQLQKPLIVARGGSFQGRFQGGAESLLLPLACQRINIDRAQWQSMSLNEKTLYVRTLLGHEKTKEAKGGNDRVFQQSTADYVKRIDDAYARGDQRTVDAIFEEMGSPR